MYLRGHQPQRPEGGFVQAPESLLIPSREEEGGAASAGHQAAEGKEGHIPCTPPALLMCVGCLWSSSCHLSFTLVSWKKTKGAKGTFLWFQNRTVICFSPQFYRKLKPTGTDDLFTFTRELNKGRNTAIVGRARSYRPSGHHPFMTPPFRHSKETISATLGATLFHRRSPSGQFPSSSPGLPTLGLCPHHPHAPPDLSNSTRFFSQG